MTENQVTRVSNDLDPDPEELFLQGVGKTEDGQITLLTAHIYETNTGVSRYINGKMEILSAARTPAGMIYFRGLEDVQDKFNV